MFVFNPEATNFTTHAYAVTVTHPNIDDGAAFPYKVHANNRDQAARYVEGVGYRVLDVNMIG